MTPDERRLSSRVVEKWNSITDKWWPGPSALAVSFLFLLGAASLLGDPDQLPWYVVWPVVIVLDSFLAFGIAALVAYVKKRREKDEDYVILRVASIGFVIWGLCTGMSAFVGMMLWAAGRSSLSLGVTVFATAFLILGLSMAGKPRRTTGLRALLLLKRIANWQLLASSAAVAVLFVPPDGRAAFFTRHGDNYGFAIAELLAWIIGAGMLTLMLEPMRFKREALGTHSETEATEV